MTMYTIGTQKFLDSIFKITIDYKYELDKPDVEQDITTLCKYFKNLKFKNLKTLLSISICELMKIIKNYSINHIVTIGCISTYADNEYMIESNAGTLTLYDLENQYFINFKNLKLQSGSKYYESHNEYAIFDYEHTDIELDV